MNRYTAYDYANKATETAYRNAPIDEQQIIGFICLGIFFAVIIIACCWPRIVEWFKRVWYRDYTIKSFIICQKTPNIDMPKIYKTVDNTNDFLRGKTIAGLKVSRKKIKSKRLISITSLPGQGCYYFIIFYRG